MAAAETVEQGGEEGALDVFISCSPLDRAQGAQMRRALGSFGVTAWLHPAEGQVEDAINALGRVHVMVLIFSEHANTCPRVRREAERAVARDLPIIPFRISEVAHSPAMEYSISTTHWFDALDGPPHTHLDRLCDSVRRLLLNSQRAQQVLSAHAALQAEMTWRPEDLEQLEILLTGYLGPVSRILVREALPLSNSKADLARRLARQIEREREREAFLAACRNAGFLEKPKPLPSQLSGAASPKGAKASVFKARAALDASGAETRRKWWQKAAPAVPDASPKLSLEERMVDDEFIAGASELLARHIGPVARVMVVRSARSSANALEMMRELAQSIPSERERSEFLHAAEKL